MKQECKTITIAGAGLMGASMAQQFAAYGYPVTLYDIAETALEKGRRLIALNQQEQIKQGKLSPAQSAALSARIAYTADKDCFAHCDLVIESIVEDMETKKSFWREVSALVQEDCMLATNTSGLSISELGGVIARPERFAGMHWFNPAHLIPLIEIISGDKTSAHTSDFLYQLAEKIGKKPIRVKKDVPGFIANRIQLAILREAIDIVEYGVGDLDDVDRCMKYGLGFRYACLGPFEVCDLGGLDTFYHIASYLFTDLCDAKQPQKLLADLYEKGAYGVKSGRGFYDYSDGRDEQVVVRRDELFLKLSGLLGEK